MTGPRVGLHLLRVGRCRHLERVTLRAGRLKVIDFPALVALIVHPSEGPILYDTGYAERFEEVTNPFPERLYRWMTPLHLPPEERLGAQLGRFGVGLGDIQKVLISHFHADHVAGLRDLPAARFLALERDVVPHLNAARPGASRWARWQALRRAYLPALLPDDFASRLSLVEGRPALELGAEWSPFAHGYDLLGDRSLIGVSLPGHSPAQLGVLLRTDDGRLVLLAADSCWSARAYRELRMPSILVRPLFDDWQAYRSTLTGLHHLALRQPELRIVPSHCDETWRAHDIAQRARLARLSREDANARR